MQIRRHKRCLINPGPAGGGGVVKGGLKVLLSRRVLPGKAAEEALASFPPKEGALDPLLGSMMGGGVGCYIWQARSALTGGQSRFWPTIDERILSPIQHTHTIRRQMAAGDSVNIDQDL